MAWYGMVWYRMRWHSACEGASQAVGEQSRTHMFVIVDLHTRRAGQERPRKRSTRLGNAVQLCVKRAPWMCPLAVTLGGAT